MPIPMQPQMPQPSAPGAQPQPPPQQQMVPCPACQGHGAVPPEEAQEIAARLQPEQQEERGEMNPEMMARMLEQS